MTHAFMVAGVLWLFSTTTLPDTEEPLRRGQIVIALAESNRQADYLVQRNPSTQAEFPPGIAAIADIPPEIPEFKAKSIDLPGAATTESTLDPTVWSGATGPSPASRPFELSADDLKLIEADRKLIESRKPAGPATSIRVFGSGDLTGHKFVFLIDRSHSMGDQGLGVLQQARTELSAAIDQLEPHHQFQIVAYHDRTATINRRQLLSATRENKKLVPEFIDNLVAFGGTNHQNGVYAALAFDPDVIVMLTDGGLPELHDGELNAIRRSVAGGTAIHAFQFGTGPLTRPDGFLKRLAEQNSGTWRYIDVREWKSK